MVKCGYEWLDMVIGGLRVVMHGYGWLTVSNGGWNSWLLFSFFRSVVNTQLPVSRAQDHLGPLVIVSQPISHYCYVILDSSQHISFDFLPPRIATLWLTHSCRKLQRAPTVSYFPPCLAPGIATVTHTQLLCSWRNLRGRSKSPPLSTITQHFH